MEIKDLLVAVSGEQNPNRRALYLIGRSGVGKSARVFSAFPQAVLLTAPYLRPQDICGEVIPCDDIKGRKITEQCVPNFILQLERSKDNGEIPVLFIDELPSAPPIIQNLLHSVINERRSGGYNLPKETLIVVAGNTYSDNDAVADSGGMSPALTSRMAFIEIDVDKDEWLEWAKGNGVADDVRAYIANAGTKALYPPKISHIDEDGKPTAFACPRSWASFGSIPIYLRKELGAGIIGKEEYTAFTAFQKYKPLNIEDIKNNCDAPKEIASQIMTIYLRSSDFTNSISDAQILYNWVKNKISPEMANVALREMCLTKPKTERQEFGRAVIA